jgi:hypothetical protein
MPRNEMNRLDLFVCVDSQDSIHDIPDTFFPAPKFFVRSAAKPTNAVLRLEADAITDDTPQDMQHRHVSDLKAAMGKELTLSCEKVRWTASMSQRAKDEWDRILDLDSM